MNKALSALREQVKAHYPGARISFAYIGSDEHNMRQFWKKSCYVVDMQKNLSGGGFLHDDLIKFHRAGLIYYFARKHGVEAAMLYKLSL